MNKDDRVRLQHMLDAAQEAIEFLRGETRDVLDTDRKLVLALVKDIEIVGEAASRISKDCQQENSQIPWPQIVSMRNRLIHAYFDIDLETVWKTVQEDLPPLITELEGILADEDDNNTNQ
ncbi:MAG: DUF86 domain-containing protein [Anaerolineae bacterium]|nr:DUF86 domain-containing protein [Anaerolineae bacterium]